MPKTTNLNNQLLTLTQTACEKLIVILDQKYPQNKKIIEALDILKDIFATDKTGECKKIFIEQMTSQTIKQNDEILYISVAIDKKMLFEGKIQAYYALIGHPVYSDILMIIDRRFDTKTVNGFINKFQIKNCQKIVENVKKEASSLLKDQQKDISANPLTAIDAIQDHIKLCSNTIEEEIKLAAVKNNRLEAEADKQAPSARELYQFSFHNKTSNNNANRSTDKTQKTSDVKKSRCLVM